MAKQRMESTSPLEDALSKAIGKCSADKEGALLHISIDNMPMIISGHGAEFASNVMAELCDEIKKVLRQDDILCSHGHDSLYAILFPCNKQRLRILAHDILQAVANYGHTVSLVPIHLVASIGSASFPADDTNITNITNKAYIALKDAHDMSIHYVAYSKPESHEIESKNQLILANYMQSAFADGKFRLAFQPIIQTKTGHTAYYEALLRVIGEDGSPLTAGPFIPIAEKMGFVDMIDGMVLQNIVHELRHDPDICFSINVSHATIRNSNWLTLATKLLSDKKLASRLIVEITETAEPQSMKELVKFIDSVKNIGCQIALDDFGSGYTSFSQLKHLQVDILKIDGVFIRDINRNKDSRYFVETLVEFAKKLGVKTVAEFVENKEIADTLTNMDIDYLQGNYLSPAVNYREWLKDEPS